MQVRLRTKLQSPVGKYSNREHILTSLSCRRPHSPISLKFHFSFPFSLFLSLPVVFHSCLYWRPLLRVRVRPRAWVCTRVCARVCCTASTSHHNRIHDAFFSYSHTHTCTRTHVRATRERKINLNLSENLRKRSHEWQFCTFTARFVSEKSDLVKDSCGFLLS